MATDIEPKDKMIEERYWTLRRLSCLVLFFGAFIFIVLGAGRVMTRDRIPSNFVTADARVTNSDIESSTVGSSVFYSAVISYQYTVAGKTIESVKTIGSVIRNDPTGAQRIVDAHSPGTILSIAYNPAEPEESRIKTSSFPAYIAFFSAGVLCFILSALSYFFIPEYLKPSKPKTQGKTADSPPRYPTEVPPAMVSGTPSATKREEVSPQVRELLGKWKLLYQVPSMREIISSSQSLKKAVGADTSAVMNSATDFLNVTISADEIEFTYLDSKLKGSCDIVSRFKCSEGKLDLEHISMDFLIADVEGFPPDSYTYELKGSKLTMKSNGIKGLGGRPIVYNFTRMEPEGGPS
jgi:hypothetical protein